PPLHHVGGVSTVNVSADGRTLLTGGKDRTARLWDAQRGTPLTPPLVHLDEVTAVSMSPDGRVVGTTCAKGFTYLWAATTGRALGPPLKSRSDILRLAAFATDSKSLLACGSSAWKWDVPGPLQGSPERIRLWTQVVTGQETDATGGVRFLSLA